MLQSSLLIARCNIFHQRVNSCLQLQVSFFFHGFWFNLIHNFCFKLNQLVGKQLGINSEVSILRCLLGQEIHMGLQHWIIDQHLRVVFIWDHVSGVGLTFRRKFSTNMRWPIVSRGIHFATKSFFELARVENFLQLGYGALGRQQHLGPGLGIDEGRGGFIKHVLSPWKLNIVSFMQDVHQVVLAHVAER